MGIYRTNNPLEYDQVDGIIIDERAPAPSVQGVGTGVALLIGQFPRGPLDSIQEPGSQQAIVELFGKSFSYPGYVALLNKKFSRLKILRVAASDAVKGTKTFDDGAATDIIKFDAKYKGVYGNSIKITIEAGSTTGRKYTITDENEFAVIAPEVYDDIVITDIDEFTFANSKLVDVTVLATSAEPEVTAATDLAGGADGTIADTDYETAIGLTKIEGVKNVLFLDVYNATRNTYLKLHAAETQDNMCILAGAVDETVTAVEAAVATLRDTDGRLIYAFNWLETLVNSVPTFVSPASFYASILSQTAPQIDPAYSGNTQFLYGVSAVKQNLSRADFIRLMEAGVSSFENDLDIGIKIRSGIVTQIANSSKLTVVRRRMTDYLTNSVAGFLKLYQNDVNSDDKRIAVKAAVLDFDRREEQSGALPTDNEVQGGVAKIVDIETLNTDETIAEGKFFIQYKRRIYSSMRFIVLIAEIGESVVVTEGE